MYFVECPTREAEEIAFKLTGKRALPITASFIDNDLQFAELGPIYDDSTDPSDLTIPKLYKYLRETFGDKPLTREEISQKVQNSDGRCVPAYYVFPPHYTAEQREKALADAFNHREMPIDLKTIEDLPISLEQQFLMVKYNAVTTKLVIFDLEKTDTYSPLANKVLAEYISTKKTATFERRSLQ